MKTMTDQEKQAWATYRQALRDLPANSSPEFTDNGNLIGFTLPNKVQDLK